MSREAWPLLNFSGSSHSFAYLLPNLFGLELKPGGSRLWKTLQAGRTTPAASPPSRLLCSVFLFVVGAGGTSLLFEAKTHNAQWHNALKEKCSVQNPALRGWSITLLNLLTPHLPVGGTGLASLGQCTCKVSLPTPREWHAAHGHCL